MGQEPIASCLSLKKGEFKGNKGIIARTKFYDGSHLNPPDNTGRRLYEKTTTGIMPNWSVGWIPLKWEFRKEKGNDETRVVSEWQLLEYSICGVPAQSDAQTIDKGVSEICFKVMPPEPADQDDREELEKKFGDLTEYKDSQLVDMEGKPYPSEHSCRINDPSKYDRIRRNNNKFGKGIHAIWGIKKGYPVELQAIRFSKDKFTPAEAKKWAKDHDYKCKLFEPASEKCEKCGSDMVWKLLVDDPENGVFSCEACKDIDDSKDKPKNQCKCDKCGHTVEWSNNCHGMKCPVEKCNGKMKTVKKEKEIDIEGEVETKGLIRYKKTPLSKESEKWDGPGERAKATVDDLKVMCLWFANEGKNKGDYKLPHHKAGGEHACVWRGVANAAARLPQTHLPSGDEPGCKRHLNKHYEEFGKETPWKAMPEEWARYEAICQELKDRNIVLSRREFYDN
jgi:hypothetical protein